MFRTVARSVRGIRATLHADRMANCQQGHDMCVPCISCDLPGTHTYPGDLCESCLDLDVDHIPCGDCGADLDRETGACAERCYDGACSNLYDL